MLRLALSVLLLGAALPAAAQEADPADVGSVDAILTAVYDVISGPASAERDWGRFRSLLHPDARLTPVGPRPDSTWGVRILSVDAYVELASPSFRSIPGGGVRGFYETERARRTERYDHIAHVWSTYESRYAPDEAPFQRGINTFQLVHDGTRWWVMSILWQGETSGAPIPAPYLPEGG